MAENPVTSSELEDFVNHYVLALMLGKKSIPFDSNRIANDT